MGSDASGLGPDELERLRAEVARLRADHDASQQREAQLREHLTATAEVLRVIASSPTDLRRALDALVGSAARLCRADGAGAFRVVGDEAVAVAATNPQTVGHRQVIAGTVNERVLAEGRTIHVHGSREEQLARYPNSPAAREGLGVQLNTPLQRAGETIGLLSLVRREQRPFSDTEVRLLETFADQAVIAIENARLFEELQERTAQLTRSVDELRALGDVGQAVSSSLDLPTVLTTIVDHAARLSGSDGGVLYEFDDTEGVFVLRANYRTAEPKLAVLRQARLRLGESAVGRAGASRAPFVVEDVATTELIDPAIREQLLADDRHSAPLERLGRTGVAKGSILTRPAPRRGAQPRSSHVARHR